MSNQPAIYLLQKQLDDVDQKLAQEQALPVEQQSEKRLAQLQSAHDVLTQKIAALSAQT